MDSFLGIPWSFHKQVIREGKEEKERKKKKKKSLAKENQ